LIHITGADQAGATGTGEAIIDALNFGDIRRNGIATAVCGFKGNLAAAGDAGEGGQAGDADGYDDNRYEHLHQGEAGMWIGAKSPEIEGRFIHNGFNPRKYPLA
jgi:hypothetical protein